MNKMQKDERKYRLGKIRGKYLILEVLKYGMLSDFAAVLLWRCDRTFREMLVENYDVFCYVM
jgi:hypothetical protein